MGGELTVTQTQQNGVLDFNRGFTPEQMQLLKDQICKGGTDDEVKMFAYQCVKRKLDPFIKQIYAIKRWDSKLGRDVMGFQTGIDGFRLTAERTGKYRGQAGPYWCGKDGLWKDIWLGPGYPFAAKVGVIREGATEPVWGIAKWDEYVQTTSGGKVAHMWHSMASNQLAKCAESLALRKAFPEDLSGIYTKEEMDQSDRVDGQEKAALMTREPEVQTAEGKTIIQPKKSVETTDPVTGDEDADWIVPQVIKPFAGRRIGAVPYDRLEKAITWGKDWFKAEGKPIAGSWKEFIDRSEKIIAERQMSLPEEDVPQNWEEPGAAG